MWLSTVRTLTPRREAISWFDRPFAARRTTSFSRGALTFTNVSESDQSAPAVLDFTDHLRDVLDDADLVGAPVSSVETVQAQVSGDRLAVTGTLGYGQSATVQYEVTVKSYDQQGDHVLNNVVAQTGSEPVCIEGSNLCTTNPVLPGDRIAPPAAPAAPGPLAAVPGLASTGATGEFLGIGLAAGGVIVLGLALIGCAIHRTRKRAAN